MVTRSKCKEWGDVAGLQSVPQWSLALFIAALAVVAAYKAVQLVEYGLCEWSKHSKAWSAHSKAKEDLLWSICANCSHVKDKLSMVEWRLESLVQLGRETQRNLVSIWVDYNLDECDGGVRFPMQCVLEEWCAWKAARQRLGECCSVQAFAVLCRAARKQVFHSLMSDAEACVKWAMQERKKAMEENKDVEWQVLKDIEAERDRVQDLFCTLRHFDQWHPFLNMEMGCQQWSESFQDTGNFAEHMSYLEEAWKEIPHHH